MEMCHEHPTPLEVVEHFCGALRFWLKAVVVGCHVIPGKMIYQLTKMRFCQLTALLVALCSCGA